MSEYTPNEAGLAAAFARGICATPADKDAYSKSLDIARRGIEEIKAEVGADDRAKRPDREHYLSEAHRRYSGSGNHPGGERHAFLAGVDAVLSSLGGGRNI